MRVPILAFVPILLFAQSQPPSPRPAKATQENKNQASPEQAKTAADQQSAPDIPSLADKVAAELARRNQQQPTDEGKQKSPTDWWGIIKDALLVFFTGALAWLAHCQHRAMVGQRTAMNKQAKYMHDGLEETRKAADAAATGAQVAKRSLEVAYQANVGIQAITLIGPGQEAVTLDSDALPDCWIEMVLINTGSTLARAFTFSYQISIYGLGEVIDQPAMIETGPTEIHPGIPFERQSLPLHRVFPDANVLWDYAVNGRNLTVSGSFSYWDIFGNQFTVNYSATVIPADIVAMDQIHVSFEVNTESNPNNYS